MKEKVEERRWKRRANERELAERRWKRRMTEKGEENE